MKFKGIEASFPHIAKYVYQCHCTNWSLGKGFIILNFGLWDLEKGRCGFVSHVYVCFTGEFVNLLSNCLHWNYIWTYQWKVGQIIKLKGSQASRTGHLNNETYEKGLLFLTSAKIRSWTRVTEIPLTWVLHGSESLQLAFTPVSSSLCPTLQPAAKQDNLIFPTRTLPACPSFLSSEYASFSVLSLKSLPRLQGPIQVLWHSSAKPPWGPWLNVSWGQCARARCFCSRASHVLLCLMLAYMLTLNISTGLSASWGQDFYGDSPSNT